jgi:hypothetical protein
MHLSASLKLRLFLIGLSCLGFSSAFAQWRIQYIHLVPGWNAVQLEITPEPSACDKILKVRK